MDMKILFVIVSIEVAIIYSFLNKKERFKIFLCILLSLSLYCMKDIAINSNIEVDVIWGINFITNLLIIVNLSLIHI